MKTLSITNSDDNVIIRSGFTLSKDISMVGVSWAVGHISRQVSHKHVY